MRLILVSALLLAILFTSCKKEEILEPIPTPQLETYSSVKTIFESSCLGCHSPNQNAYIVDLTNYESIKNYLDGTNTMIDRLNSDDEFYRMPPSGNLSDTEKQMLIDWINDGYLE
ncbi:MAG: hypothetical protein VXZ76_02560 [Bacteroidota bacterium]|nr:hypothetical protein [Bacteroidota bacterium]